MEHGDPRFDIGFPAIGRNSANDKARIVWALLLNFEAWYEARKLIELGQTEIIKRLGIDGADGDRNVAQNLFALLDGYCHCVLAKFALICSRILRKGRRKES